MAALAGILKEKGFFVSGSDASRPYYPSAEVLRRAEVVLKVGYSAEHITELKPDCVVVGNAVRRDNPEVIQAKALGIELISMPEALKRWFISGRKSLVVAGTHGKTTTSALLFSVLSRCGLSPGLFCGGILKELGVNYGLGKGEFVVIEGDEYDTCFFDKSPKFLHYEPFSVLLTSVEFDHADLYRSFEDVKGAFRKLVSLIPSEGFLVFFWDDPVVRGVSEYSKAHRIPYGKGVSSGVRLLDYKESRNGSEVRVRCFGEELRLKIPLYGLHNALNVLGVLGVSKALGLNLRDVAEALSEFRGVARRQELYRVGRALVVDDFAHHPTAVKATLEALKASFRPKEVLVCFEPRTNTSKRKVFFEDYLEAFDGASSVYIKIPPGIERIPEEERFDVTRFVEELRRRGKDAEAFFKIPVEELILRLKEGTLLVFMSSAEFPELRELLEKTGGRGYGKEGALGSVEGRVCGR